MRGRFCYVAERGFGAEEFSRVIETLNGVGITLANPWNGTISRLTDEGDQVETSQGQIRNAIEASLAVTFQVWFSEDTDLVCSLYQLANGAFAQRYNLDGLAPKERNVVEKWAISYFTERSAVAAALLLVVDNEASTAGYDWDGFVEGRCEAPNRPPEVIGVCSPLEIECAGLITDLNGCRFITNRIPRIGYTE